jgi:hypothetical protein
MRNVIILKPCSAQAEAFILMQNGEPQRPLLLPKPDNMGVLYFAKLFSQLSIFERVNKRRKEWSGDQVEGKLSHCLSCLPSCLSRIFLELIKIRLPPRLHVVMVRATDGIILLASCVEEPPTEARTARFHPRPRV